MKKFITILAALAFGVWEFPVPLHLPVATVLPVTDTIRGAIIFAAVILTIGIWAPLRNKPERLSSGVIVTETYFGFFKYLTLRTELKEPEYKMQWQPSYPRLALTAFATAALWSTAIPLTRRGKNPPS